MNHTVGPVPLEMGPDVHGNRWLREHADSMRLRVDDWDAFRDPDALTYGSYVAMQGRSGNLCRRDCSNSSTRRATYAAHAPALDLLAAA
jgi:toluene monooxygenase system protein E